MKLPDWIRSSTYHPLTVKIARFLHINRFLRDIYCRLSFPKEKKIELSFASYKAWFSVNTPLELRIVEAPLEKGMGEYFVLEKLLQAIHSGDVVYDIGASLGTHTIFIAKTVGENGRVIAFEPETKSYKALNVNIELNNLMNVTPINVALGSHSGKATLFSYGEGYGSFNLTHQGALNSPDPIEIVPGDAVIENKKLPLPRIVKIDVEGYEYAAISGLKNTLSDKNCEVVCCEIHPTMLPKEVTSDDVLELLKSCGFNRIETHQRGDTFHVFCYKR